MKKKTLKSLVKAYELDPRYPSAGRQFREAVETLRALVGSVDPEKEEGK